MSFHTAITAVRSAGVSCFFRRRRMLGHPLSAKCSWQPPTLRVAALELNASAAATPELRLRALQAGVTDAATRLGAQIAVSPGEWLQEDAAGVAGAAAASARAAGVALGCPAAPPPGVTVRARAFPEEPQHNKDSKHIIKNDEREH